MVYLFGFLGVHLVHWFINLALEFKNTKSCGAAQRHEGIFGFVMLFIGFAIPTSVGIVFFFNVPDWSYIQFGTDSDDCCKWWIPIAWIGIVAGVINVLAFAYVHYSLGLNWSGTVTLKKEHKLVTSGPYRFARHPMYAVCLFLPLILFMITANWLFSLSFLLALIYPVSRCRKEERLMQLQFGQDYQDYMNRVGPFFPCAIPFWGNKIVLPDLETSDGLVESEANHEFDY